MLGDGFPPEQSRKLLKEILLSRLSQYEIDLSKQSHALLIDSSGFDDNRA
jgi:hypothetical protein